MGEDERTYPHPTKHGELDDDIMSCVRAIVRFKSLRFGLEGKAGCPKV